MLDIPLTYQIIGEPIPKPRMTRADKWKKRDCVLKYRAWADACRRAITGSPLKKMEGDEYILMFLTFYLSVPDSYPVKKKKSCNGHFHKVRPDIDNLIKSAMDALFVKDSVLPMIFARKFYVLPNDTPRTCLTLFKSKHIRKELCSYNSSVALYFLRDNN